MEHRAVTDVATGSFRLRKSDQHAASSTIVDMDNDELITLTTVEVSDGVVLLHCLDSSMTALEEAEDEADDEAETEEESEEASEEASEDEETDEDEDEEEEDGEEAEHSAKGRTYTVASGNSVTVRAAVIRLEPIGKQTAEGTYRIHVLQVAG
ncbi:hypothetical protein [Reyranella soli]|jgi:hypothetical protein|uniref:Uncharacterized protein n=1 Tax=Reyranella soli TaxID=1230389 RepID=A0A512N2H6_9HYPH|nr:hypothetical protein [Reyranella soli]GEP53182.1 hypothetical protein RSO01_03480 [Reyranella soli]